MEIHLESKCSTYGKNFIWLVCMGHVLTNHERTRRKMADDGRCCICGASDETMLHPLRDCRVAKDIWLLVLPLHDTNNFFGLGLEDWLAKCLKDYKLKNVQGAWSSPLFAIVCWLIWKQRNNDVFNQQLGSTESVV